MSKMIRLFALSILLCTLFLSVVWSLSAQESAVSTPTSAPSKTPPPTATVSDEQSAEAETADAESALPALPRPYTQDDLSVLVGNVQRPNGIIWFDNQLYTACNGDWTLYRIDSETGSTITFVFGVQNAHQLYAEETEGGFNLWIPDPDTNQLVLVDHRQTAPRPITSDALDIPWGITPLDEEHFLISNLRANNLVEVSRDGEVREVVNGLRGPAGLARQDDFVYVANNGSARRAIEWFDINELPEDESTDAIMQPLVTGLQNASGLTMAQDGYLYFTYALGTRGVVGRIDPVVCREDGCTNDDVEIVVFTELQAPLAGLTISDDMRLFVHTIFRPEIYWIQLPEPSTT